MSDDEIYLLQAAWFVTLISISLLFAALCVASIWNPGIYLTALNQALLEDHF